MKPLTLVTTPTRHRRFNELVGLLLLLLAALLLLALISYRSSDPSLDTAGAAAVHNWTGRLGAGISDVLLQMEGAAAFALPCLLLGLAWTWFRSRAAAPGAPTPAVRLVGLLLTLAVGPALFALLPGHWQLFGAIPLGGIAGTLLLDALVRWLNFPGACVLVVFLAAVAAYLLTSFSVSGLRQTLLVRLAIVPAVRDRLRNYRLARAERAQARAAAREERKADARALRQQEQEEDAAYLAGSGTERAGDAGPELGAGMGSELRVGAVGAALSEEDRVPLPRRGSFAELHEAHMSAPWDDEAFLEAIGPAEPAGSAGRALPAAAAARVAEDSGAFLMPVPAAALAQASAPGVPARAAGPQGTQGIRFSERADADARPVTMTARSVHGFASAYKLPPTTLLHRSEESATVREEELRAEAQVLVEKCGEFDVGGQVVQINPGPVVTTFEFRPEAGVKYSRVTGLADDLCLAMAAESILIERMAGKSTVGIQVPNSERETIWLRDIIEAEGFAHSKSKITMAMGKDINGRIVVADLATMPHVLIAGSTGSGKSVAINAMIMSVLYKATPEQVRLILVDPKRVELGMYEGVPHLFTPIITEPKLAANALKNAVREMERRLKLLASRSVRNIDQYNRLFDDQPTLWDEQGVEETPLPYIMIIIDELADLMILDKSNVEEAITRLAQMARAVGIHLVLATQRPSVDVITGLIKANVPTRMSFRLATKIDSRTILDTNGAESLLGRGDMLFLPPGTSRLQRVHAPFVTEKEIAGVVSFWKAQGEARYAEGFLDAPKDAQGRDLDGDGEGVAPDENDPLFDDAVRLVFEFGKASTSLLQRRMRIGYGRAAALIDMMERDGLVGPPEGSKPRELLKPASWLNESDEALR